LPAKLTLASVMAHSLLAPGRATALPLDPGNGGRLACRRAARGKPIEPTKPARLDRLLLQRPELAGAKAILAVDANAYFSRPGPRLVDGVEILASALHPGRLAPPPAGTAVQLIDEPDR
jgi:hypothetical protein